MRVVGISDVHFGDHDISAWNLTKKIIPDLNADLIYLLGDIWDFKALTRFLVSPQDSLFFQKEVNTGVKALASLRDVYQGRIKFRKGNHEERLIKYLYTNAKRLASIDNLHLPNLLKLSDLDIEYYEADKKGIFDKIGKLNFFHGHEIRVSNPDPARKIFQKILDNGFCGHHHVFDSYIARSLTGEYRGVYVNATLQKQDPEWAGFTNWSQGISVIDFSPSGYFDIDQLCYFKKGSKMMTMVNTQAKKLYIN